MNTSMEGKAERRSRRRHSAEFKREVVATCRQQGVSVAAIALANGLNANLLRRWVLDAERRVASKATLPGAVSAGRVTEPTSFVAIPLDPGPPLGIAGAADSAIRIELQRAGTSITVQWPVSSAQSCVAWLRDLLR